MNYGNILSKEFNIKEEHSNNIIALINEGNTLPFIARYRKEMTGAIDDQILRDFNDRYSYLLNLTKRKQDVADIITEQGKMTPEILLALDKAETLAVVEDIYRPYKEKKKTRAGIAIEKGMQPLADIILEQAIKQGKPLDIAANYLNEEKEVDSPQKALAYAMDIVAESISDNREIRAILREKFNADGELSVEYNLKNIKKEDEKTPPLGKKNENAHLTYAMYENYKENIINMPSHRILAINRGEKEGFLKVNFLTNKENAINDILNNVIKGDSIFKEIIEKSAEDSYTRLIFPSLERETRSQLTDKANEQAIKMFELNLEPLLMQPPLKNRRILGLDPAYRTGCKIAVIDELGNVLATDVIYPTPPQSKIEEATEKMKKLIAKHKVDVISIGNGTASKEAEIFVAGLIKQCDKKLNYIIVNEAGASVYSASKLGAEEFPDFDVSLRSAISIARRLLDPLAELIKIDVKSIGVGQYQHDMPEARLESALGGVVESCVNNVGVDINSASISLLSYVAGLNSGIAKNIIEYRKTNPFKNRKQLMDVKKLGAKAFEQCAGFLRIINGENILDNTAVHPESYAAAENLLKTVGLSLEDVKKGNISDLKQRIEKKSYDKVASECNIGIPTLKDVIEELQKPGRDIRESLPEPILRSDLLDINDLKAGMELVGVVRNVTDFGVFVDIGVHQDGLVHKSEIADRYVAHPSELLKVSDVVTVRVKEVDVDRKKISLTMKTGDKPVASLKRDRDKRKDDKILKSYDNKNNKPIEQKEKKQEKSLDEMLQALKNKFNG